MAERTLFDLPNSPEQIGVVLPPANLRKIDFSGLDFATARRAAIEYIQTYYPDVFNDFVASNGVIMMAELISAAVGKLSLRGDIQARNAYLPTATDEEAVSNLLALINQRMRRQTPAVVDVEISVTAPVASDVEIEPGQVLEVRSGMDGQPVRYEVYRAPGDFETSIIIPSGKRGVVAYGIEGEFASPVTLVSAGGINQVYTITDTNILDDPIKVTVSDDDVTEEWVVIREPIEKYGPNDKVVEVSFMADNLYLRFGDGVNGVVPDSGNTISVTYRGGGGIRGRVGVGQLQDSKSITPLPPVTAPIQVRFRNLTPSVGGTDKETIEQAKRRAPKEYAVREAIVTPEDYAHVASSFAHPAFGTMAKAVSSVRTGKNANLVELYCLAEGANELPVVPSAGLKTALITYVDGFNTMTDQVDVLDGKIRYIDIDMTVAIKRDADAAVTKNKVESAVLDFFALSKWEMGKPFYVSNFVEAVERIDGVAYLDLFKPVDNVVTPDLAFNELITLGDKVIRYYYEKAE